jgi:hypothetical protein
VKKIDKSKNSGYCNSGNYNSGNYNSGDYNSGDCNSGDCNSGNCNSGYRNSGNYNSGDRNSGYYNSGNRNSGNRNSGDCNSGYYNSGNGYRNYFCTKTRFFLFDLEVDEGVVEKVKDILQLKNFDLSDGYKAAWAKIPKKMIDRLFDIPEFQTDEAKRKFTEITGLEVV